MASLVLGAYLIDMKAKTGFGGPTLTRSGNYNVPNPGSQPGYWDRFGQAAPASGTPTTDTRRARATP